MRDLSIIVAFSWDHYHSSTESFQVELLKLIVEVDCFWPKKEYPVLVYLFGPVTNLV